MRCQQNLDTGEHCFCAGERSACCFCRKTQAQLDAQEVPLVQPIPVWAPPQINWMDEAAPINVNAAFDVNWADNIFRVDKPKKKVSKKVKEFEDDGSLENID